MNFLPKGINLFQQSWLLHHFENALSKVGENIYCCDAWVERSYAYYERKKWVAFCVEDVVGEVRFRLAWSIFCGLLNEILALVLCMCKYTDPCCKTLNTFLYIKIVFVIKCLVLILNHRNNKRKENSDGKFIKAKGINAHTFHNRYP